MHKYFCTYMCGLSGCKCKITSYHKIIHCSNILSNKSYTKHHSKYRNYQKFIKLSTSHKFKIGEKFMLIVSIAIQYNLTLLTIFSYCHTILTGTRVQSEQLIAHNSSIVRKIDACKCYKHMTPFHLAHNSFWCQLHY